MEVPPECRPQHHGNLTCRTRWRTELMTAGVAYTADEEMVVLQGRSFEAVDVLFFRSSQHWYVVFGAMGIVWMELRMRGRGNGRLMVFRLVLRM